MHCRCLALLLLASSVGSAQNNSTAAMPKYGWLGAWTTANMPMDADRAAKLNLGALGGDAGITLRQVVHLSQGGKQMRIRFSNEFGTDPLRISAAHVAFIAAGSRILPATDKPLLFQGQAGVTIPAGGVASSDTVVETVPNFSDLVISAAIPAQTISVVTHHGAAHATTFVAAGDQTAALEFAPPTAATPGTTPPAGASLAAGNVSALGGTATSANGATLQQDASAPGTRVLLQNESWFFLKDVEVDSDKKGAAVVCLGDSITDGTGSTTDTNRRWPDIFSGLLLGNTPTEHLSVLNVGIGGNRLLADGTGPKASSRYERDVLSQAGVKFVILLEGINDIGKGVPTAQDLIAAMTDLAARAHARGIRVIGGTLTPYEGAGYYTPAGEAVRQQVNAFLRSNTVFDGVVDFDKAAQDPQHPTRFLPKDDHGDHLHPSDDGYAAMGAAVQFKLFKKALKK